MLVRPLRGDERLTELPQIPPEGATAPALASGARNAGPVRWEIHGDSAQITSQNDGFLLVFNRGW